MAQAKYSMSFTTGGLLSNESEKVARLYLELSDWALVRARVLEAGLMQTRMQSSAKRIYREISSRLQTLTIEEIELLVNGSTQQRIHLLWLAVCCRYSFIHDFSVEILRERFLTLRHEIANEDFDAFFNAKAEWHHELDTITPGTRAKLRQNIFRILREAEYISSSNRIQATVLSPQVLELIMSRGEDMICIYPTLDSESNQRAK
jgi:hypothetical protein